MAGCRGITTYIYVFDATMLCQFRQFLTLSKYINTSTEGRRQNHAECVFENAKSEMFE